MPWKIPSLPFAMVAAFLGLSTPRPAASTRPMTAEEIAETQRLVNDAIQRDLPITCEEMPVEEARKTGAIGLFGDKYGEVVKVYTMGDFSKEICGGPHAEHTGQLGHFVIQKEQSSSSGVRRIKAILER